ADGPESARGLRPAARAFPATPIVLDHVGVRSASAPMPASATRSSQNGAHESASSRPALHIKLGGARHADVRLHRAYGRIAAELRGVGRGLAALYRDLHRRAKRAR